MQDEHMNETYWRALLERDRRFDGRFVYGVTTTGVYCRPSCGARTPLRKNVRFYPSPAEAGRDGLRPCLRCRPLDDPAARMTEIRAHIEAHADEPLPLALLAKLAGMSRFHFQRTFKAETGMSPRRYQEAFRLQRLKQSLRETASVTDAVYDAGFGSSSRVYERSGPRLGMTPGQYRAGGRGIQVSYASFSTPLGPMLLGATDRGICYLQFDSTPDDLRREFPLAALHPAPETAPLREWAARIAAFVEAELPLALAGTPFQMKVWEFLCAIPPGETRTYTQVATAIGRPNAVRAVARACASNRVAILVPCHRVIRGDGQSGGYRWGPERKSALLQAERGK